ncbi:hypothetical protein [Peribacillus sp. NPDC058075]|uniref:hypothetical protein n=1 Tax=unclassified Peribacillus TaxID=2675266 RepID=UPI0036DDE6C4
MKKIFTVLFLMMVLTACGSDSTKSSHTTNLEATKEDTKEATKEDTNQEKTEHNYQFAGESEHWEAVYSYKGTEIWGKNDSKQTTHSSKDNYKLVLTYKGSLEELASIKNLEYTYETTTSSGTKTEVYTEPLDEKVFSMSGASENGAIIGEGEVIKVYVKWDDFEETFELHNKVK